jgi:hypothetical protein
MLSQSEFDALPEPQRVKIRSLFSRQIRYTEWTTFLNVCYPPTPMSNFVAVADYCGMFVAVLEDGSSHT